MKINPVQKLRGTVEIPGDKSISHRSIMFGALAKGTTEISHFLTGADCLSTIDCFQKMGIEITQENEHVTVRGKGLRGLTPPEEILNAGNSGTTARLLSGILCGQNFSSEMSGDASLNSRPMKRVIDPLARMNSDIRSKNGDNCAPLLIGPSSLHGIHYQSPVSSAQVKSAILLAGLYADSETSVAEPALSRNHTELMLSSFGASVSSSVDSVTGAATATILPCEELFARNIVVPGDISSAAYFIAAGLLVPGSELLLKNVGINPTRAGILDICRKMGADITYLNVSSDGEPTADLLVRAGRLHGTEISGSVIPTLIDEIPMLAVMAACAEGETVIRDAAELKVKESNRIDTTAEGLTRMGVHVQKTDDGMIISGNASLRGAVVDSYLDHRIAMAFSIAGLVADGTTEIRDSHCVDISYPSFYETLHSLA